MSKHSKRYKKNTRIKKKAKGKKFFFVTVLVFVCLGLFFVMFLRRGERNYVRSIRVEGTSKIAALNIIEKANLSKGSLLKPDDINEAVNRLKSNKWIQDASITYGPFGALTIAIQERKPIAILKNSEPSLLCSDGKVIPYESAFDSLPFVYLDNGENPLQYVARIKKIKEVFGPVSMKISFKNKDMTLIYLKKFKIIFGRMEPLFLWSCNLEKSFFPNELLKIIDEEKNEGYTSCDMRFRKQIIFAKGGA